MKNKIDSSIHDAGSKFANSLIQLKLFYKFLSEVEKFTLIVLPLFLVGILMMPKMMIIFQEAVQNNLIASQINSFISNSDIAIVIMSGLLLILLLKTTANDEMKGIMNTESILIAGQGWVCNGERIIISKENMLMFLTDNQVISNYRYRIGNYRLIVQDDSGLWKYVCKIDDNNDDDKWVLQKVTLWVYSGKEEKEFILLADTAKPKNES